MCPSCTAKDWVLLRDDDWELTRLKAMAQVISLRRSPRELGIEAAVALAASSILIQGPRRPEPKELSSRQLHQ